MTAGINFLIINFCSLSIILASVCVAVTTSTLSTIIIPDVNALLSQCLSTQLHMPAMLSMINVL